MWAYSLEVTSFCVKMKRVNAKISLGQHDKFECELMAVTGRQKRKKKEKRSYTK